jgi:hypothetical protein
MLVKWTLQWKNLKIIGKDAAAIDTCKEQRPCSGRVTGSLFSKLFAVYLTSHKHAVGTSGWLAMLGNCTQVLWEA